MRLSLFHLAFCMLLGTAFFLRPLPLAASEIICRYCDQVHERAAMLPPGLELEGSHHYAPDRQVDVTHIKLDVTPNFASKTVAGTATITATVLAAPVEVLRLDAVNLAVTAVRCDQQPLRDFSVSKTDLQIVFAEPVAPGTTVTLAIEYTAEPQ